MTLSIVHAPALLPSEEDVRSRLQPPERREYQGRPLQVRISLGNESDLPWNLVGATRLHLQNVSYQILISPPPLLLVSTCLAQMSI